MGGITITAIDGKSPAEEVKDILKRFAQNLNNCGSVMRSAMSTTVKRHFQTIYPGSQHYSPKNVHLGEKTGTTAEIVIDVPGITRAYKNLTILPKKARKLSIPVDTYAKSPREVDGLFYVKNKKGTEMLAKTIGGQLVVMYILKDRVNQPKDSRLMPSDNTLAANIFARISAYLDSRKI